MRAVSPADLLRSGLCIGCGSCVADAAVSGADMRLNPYGQYVPAGPPQWSTRRSRRLGRICPFSPSARDEDRLSEHLFPEARIRHASAGRFLSAFVGHVAEDDFRASGSSGGMATWVLVELLRRGRVDRVAHVAPTRRSRDDPFFGYRISTSEAEIRAGAHSRYYPVELSSVIGEVRTVPGRYAVVGIPCFIKAIQLLRAEDPIVRERVVHTVGLFCGHMKSARFTESFANQLGVRIEDVQEVEFRAKDPDRPANTYTAELTLRDGRVVRRDWWNLVDGDWGAGFFQSIACNACDDVVAETADISCGDAWVEPYASDGRGTNVIVVRSAEVDALVRKGLRDGRLSLEEVDGEFVERTQAAGLRQRREGLAYRLTWRQPGLSPMKRVSPAHTTIRPRRKLIYRMRHFISETSHRIFRTAARLGQPGIYARWARLSVSVYHAVAYSRGRLGRFVERLVEGRGD